MTIPANVRVNAQLPFPSLVYGTGPITLSKANGIWQVGFNVLGFATQQPLLRYRHSEVRCHVPA